MINFIQKRSNLIMGLLLALLLVLVFIKTISVTGMHDVNVKDFSIMRTVSVPNNSDVKECLSIFKDELGDSFNFDWLYSTTYLMVIFGAISLVLCFKKYNKSFISKVIIFAYSLYTLLLLVLPTNMSYILKTYDRVYIFKVIIIALVLILSAVSIIMMLRKLASEGWLEKVNIHAFLNSICAFLMFAVIAVMFIPYEFANGKTTSIMGYMLLPGNYSAFKSFLTSNNSAYAINSSIFIPVVLFVLAVIDGFLCIGTHKNPVPTILSLAWAVIGIIGFILSSLLHTDPKMILYIVLFAATGAAAIVNLIQFRKVRKILDAQE